MIGKLVSLLTGSKAVAEEVIVDNPDQHDEIYKRGSELISPYMKLAERDPKVTKRVRDKVTRGIRDLDAVTTFNPKNWPAFWIKGKGYQVLGDQVSANFEFKSSFAIQKESPDVAREYAASCIELGHGDEAVKAAQHAIRLDPEDPGLRANLALAFLISSKNQDAMDAIERSLNMSPDDKILQTVKMFVDEVIAGKRKQPKTMADFHKN
jgi:tetratricopeptide (TPR) repeat protein